MSTDKIGRIDAVMEMAKALLVPLATLITQTPEARAKAGRDIEVLMQAIEVEIAAIINDKPRGTS